VVWGGGFRVQGLGFRVEGWGLVLRLRCTGRRGRRDLEGHDIRGLIHVLARCVARPEGEDHLCLLQTRRQLLNLRAEVAKVGFRGEGRFVGAEGLAFKVWGVGFRVLGVGFDV